MSGTMSQADLVTDLKLLLMDAATEFKAAADAELVLQLAHAAQAMQRKRPLAKTATATLVAEQADYSGVPADLVELGAPEWGVAEKRARQPWDTDWPGPLPRPSIAQGASGRVLRLDPAPTAAQITAFGETYRYRYIAAHAIGAAAADTTVAPGDRQLLLLRAAAEAMLFLASKGVTKPVQLHRGLGAMPNAGQPWTLHQQLMAAWEQM